MPKHATKAAVGGKLIAVMSILEKKDLKSITLYYGSREKKGENQSQRKQEEGSSKD